MSTNDRKTAAATCQSIHTWNTCIRKTQMKPTEQKNTTSQGADSKNTEDTHGADTCKFNKAEKEVIHTCNRTNTGGYFDHRIGLAIARRYILLLIIWIKEQLEQS